MAVSSPKVMIILMFTMFLIVDGQLVELTTEALDQQPPSTMPVYDELGDNEEEIGKLDRRSLYGSGIHYYISYAALSANRVPCPPRSGRSYDTQNCFRARTPVNPYTRGCSSITHCRN